MNAEAAVTVARRIPFGSYRGVTLDVAAWDAVGAEVDLSCACMFEHELGPGLTGGLEHLDRALSGALLALRRDKIFLGDVMETLLLAPASGIRGRSLLMVGLGDPDEWSAPLMARVTRCVVAAANDRSVASAGIAPGLLDSGLSAALTAGASEAMLSGVVAGIHAAHRLAELGLAPPPSLAAFTFGAGVAHADEAADHFRRSLSAITRWTPD